MPGYFKKRRHAQGPNKNEEKILRAKRLEGQARLGSRYSSIKQLRLELVFLDARGNELDKKSLSLGPNDSAALTFPCPGLCGRGSFGLEPKLSESLPARSPNIEFELKCAESYAGSSQPCGCQAKARFVIDYFPAPAAPPAEPAAPTSSPE